MMSALSKLQVVKGREKEEYTSLKRRDILWPYFFYLLKLYYNYLIFARKTSVSLGEECLKA